MIERIRVRDGQRTTAASLALFRKVSGQIDSWFGLTLDNSPIVTHLFTASEIYQLQWTAK